MAIVARYASTITAKLTDKTECRNDAPHIKTNATPWYNFISTSMALEL
jgi:hypothetical protein